jgi:hypothetical protein
MHGIKAIRRETALVCQNTAVREWSEFGLGPKIHNISPPGCVTQDKETNVGNLTFLSAIGSRNGTEGEPEGIGSPAELLQLTLAFRLGLTAPEQSVKLIAALGGYGQGGRGLRRRSTQRAPRVPLRLACATDRRRDRSR